MAPDGECPSDALADVTDGPKDEKEEGTEEDELAEYGLDKYDEEDVGEDICALFLGEIPTKHFTTYCVYFN